MRVDGLTWRPHGRTRPVLPGIDLDIPAGQRLLLVGASGSGKSTLLRALAGVLETTGSGDLTGQVTIGDRPPGERAGRVGLVLQEPGAGLVGASVGRDVAFGLENVALPREQMPGRVAAALHAVGLGGLPLDTPTSALSGGQTQRLALAGALALEPDLLLLDEPTAMLDPDSAAEVRAAVDQVAGARGLTTVIVEHRLQQWLPQVDRLVVLDEQGRVSHDGPPEEVLARHGDELAAAGIWVPGVPAPEPMALPSEALGAGDGPGTGDLGAPLARCAPLEVRRPVPRADGTRAERLVLRTDDELRVAPGAAVALVGPSGGGKSTWLRVLAGFQDSGGSVRIGDLDPADPPRPEALPAAVGWVPQWSSAAIVARSVLEEVLATTRHLGRERSEDRERARRLLDVLGLGHLADADPRWLSGGEQRRLAVAAAAFHGPDLLLADEPTVGQDRGTWAAVTGLLLAQRAAGRGVVVATHDDALVARTDEVRQVRRPEEPEPPSPARPPLARCGPLSLMLAGALAIPAAILSPGWPITLAALAVVLVGAVVGLWGPGAGRRWATLARLLVPGAVGALSVGWSTWFLGSRDLAEAATAAARVALIVAPSALVVPLVDPDELGDHLGQRLRLPARPVVALAAALQRLQLLESTWRDMGDVRRVRGLGVTWRRPASVLRHAWALTVGVLLRSLLAAAELAVAMDARGFATGHRRTWYAPAPWRTADSVLTLVAMLPLVVVLVALLR